jgi:hypothetical protein
VLEAALQGFDLAAIMLAVIFEVDGKSVKHKVYFLRKPAARQVLNVNS